MSMQTVVRGGGSFGDRALAGHSGQAELSFMLTRNGFDVMQTGQENWMPGSVHDALRFEHDDLMVRAVRYTPDLLAYRADFPLAWWEAKVNVTPGTMNFTLEKACYDELMARHEKGERVVVAFRDTDSKWRANWVEKLCVERDMSGQRLVARGSHTPYLLIPKAATVGISDFLP